MESYLPLLKYAAGEVELGAISSLTSLLVFQKLLSAQQLSLL